MTDATTVEELGEIMAGMTDEEVFCLTRWALQFNPEWKITRECVLNLLNDQVWRRNTKTPTGIDLIPFLLRD